MYRLSTLERIEGKKHALAASVVLPNGELIGPVCCTAYRPTHYEDSQTDRQTDTPNRQGRSQEFLMGEYKF